MEKIPTYLIAFLFAITATTATTATPLLADSYDIVGLKFGMNPNETKLQIEKHGKFTILENRTPAESIDYRYLLRTKVLHSDFKLLGRDGGGNYRDMCVYPGGQCCSGGSTSRCVCYPSERASSTSKRCGTNNQYRICRCTSGGK